MIRITILVVVLLSILLSVAGAQDLVWEDISRGSRNFSAVLINLSNNKIIFAASSGSVLKSSDEGKSWRNVLSIRGANRNINVLAADLSSANIVYAATDNGLYRSIDLGSRWERIYRGKNNLENQSNCVLSRNEVIFVGTKAGLFISRDNGRSWLRCTDGLDRDEILSIDASHKTNLVIYLAATSGIFKSLDNGRSWEKIYIGYSKENTAEQNEDKETPDKTSEIRFIKSGISNVNLLYFSGTKGIYKSMDQGKSWEKLGEYGLLNRNVKMLCLSENSQLFALTDSGIFSYENSHWTEMSFGIEAGKFTYLTIDNKSNIYVSGEKGLFRADMKRGFGFSQQGIIQDYLKYEPRIKDVQEAAIRYAEVSPEKISGWRKLAAKKALLPQVNVGLDRNSTDLWHWETGSTTKNEDDTLRRGQDSIDWDVSLSWDLSDLIWNDAQASIDVRSKLMVELRDDILDQVNKLYFERLRVKSELDNLPIEDRKRRFVDQLKLEELTASLDSLTAGYYSEQLRQLAPKQ
jgi:photosystem II stability/assembly factor-like uncharacterized protein